MFKPFLATNATTKSARTFGVFRFLHKQHKSYDPVVNGPNDDGEDWHFVRCFYCRGWGVGGEKCCQTPPHLIVLLLDGGWSARAPLCAAYNCHLALIQSSAALRPHLLLRMSDRTAATYDQTLLSLCACDISLKEALMCCQQWSPLSCHDLPSPSVSVKQH